MHYIAIDRRSDGFMATATGIFRDLVIEFRNLDSVRIVAVGEVEGMPEPIVCFHRILADDVVWRVTVVAGCGEMMA